MKKDRKRRIVIGIAVTVMFLSVAFIIGYVLEIRERKEAWEQETLELRREEQRLEEEQARRKAEAQRREQEEEKERIEKEKDELLYREIDWDALDKKNKDIYAWISIPELDIDYPVLQGSSDDFYLNHDESGNKDLRGSIYSNTCTRKDFSDVNTILYGHNMKNGSMFGNLSDAADTDLQENAMIYIYTQEATYTYRMYALVQFSDSYLPDMYGIRSEKGTRAFLTAIEKSPAWFLRETRLTEDQQTHLLTLSTCTGAKGEKRCLLVAEREGTVIR